MKLKTGNLVISLHTIQSFRTSEAVHVQFCALHKSSHELTEVFKLINMNERFNRRNVEKIFYDFKVFISTTFISNILKSFNKIIIINNRMTFLMQC